MTVQKSMARVVGRRGGKQKVSCVWTALFLLLLFSPVCGLAVQTVESQAGKRVTMDFQDVDLRQVIRFVAEMTGRNYVMDDQVKGRVTVITPSPVTIEEAGKIFESILSVQGFTIVDREGALKILPLKDGKTEGQKLSVEGRDEGKGEESLVSQLVWVSQVDSGILVAALKPLVHPWGAIVAHPPSNAIIITDTRATVDQIVVLVKAMDVPPELATQKVFRVENATVTRLEKLMNSIFSEFNSAIRKGSPGVKFFSDTRTNLLIVLAPGPQMQEVEQLIKKLDVSEVQASSGNLHLYYPKNGKAEIIAKILNDLIHTSAAATAGAGVDVRRPLELNRTVNIVGEKETNTIVIAAAPEDYQVLLPIIEGLDMRRLQVHVEALILEVTSDRAADFGVEWRFASTYKEGSSKYREFGGTSFGGINNLMANPLKPDDGMSLGLVRGGINVAGVVIPNLGSLIQALQSDTDVNILATPNVITMDNEEAEIMVGENIPVRTGTTSGTGSTTTSSYERKDVGITLRIRPNVMEDGWLRMEIYQEQSSLSDRTLTIGNNETEIVTKKRSIKTQAIMHSGEMVVLGGLVTEQNSDKVKQVPCLGGIRGVGELFKQTSRSKTKSNLMVFLRPVIVNTYADLLDLTRGKLAEIGSAREDRHAQGTSLIPTFKIKPLPLLSNERIGEGEGTASPTPFQTGGNNQSEKRVGDAIPEPEVKSGREKKSPEVFFGPELKMDFFMNQP